MLGGEGELEAREDPLGEQGMYRFEHSGQTFAESREEIWLFALGVISRTSIRMG